VILIAGFLVIYQSGFTINSHMGLLTAITIGFALFADFLFLPPLIIKLEKSYINFAAVVRNFIFPIDLIGNLFGLNSKK